METPNSVKKDPFIVENGVLQMPFRNAPVTVEQQIPKVAQFTLSIEADREKLSKLFDDAFRKKVYIWMMDKNWAKDGDCVVVTFYSDIIEKPKMTESNKVVVVTVEEQEKEDKMFNEFIAYLNAEKNEEKTVKNDIEIEDDSD